MSTTAILAIGLLTVVLVAIFLILTLREMKRAPLAVMPFSGEPTAEIERMARAWDARASARAGGPRAAATSSAPIQMPASGPLRVLVATDGSACSDIAVQTVATRPWPAGSQIEVVTVVHTAVPAFPDPQLMIEAAHVQALEADRQRAPDRATRAARALAGVPGVEVSTRVLEGSPAEALIEEADRWDAHLLVVGSHGAGPGRRRILGSVSQTVSLHAPCSVEIVRCSPRGT